jgi:GDPmannose 4,6-dehydratase
LKNKILIIGILGQDGQFLTEILNNNDYEIIGICKPNTEINRIDNFQKKYNIKIIDSDLTKYSNVIKVLNDINPNCIVNLGGISNVFNPWDNIDLIYKQNCLLPINIIKYIANKNNEIFFFQASSSLMFGGLNNAMINEKTNFNPIYPYGINKLYVHNFINEYRKKYKLKLSSGIFFNHESYLRNKNFLSKKVAIFVSEILKGFDKKLYLGDLSSYKDISHAKDFMMGVKLILENEFNEDFVFSSKSQIKTYDFVNKFFTLHNLNMNDYVIFDSNGRNENLNIFGDNEKLKSIGWIPSYTIDDLIIEMVKYEL